ncbi:hypothetical protein ES703_123674 [subsurface metagenome]
MKNVILSIVVVSVLVAGGIGSTFAGFVDTEESKNNFVEAGISDLLINGFNDPNVPHKLQMDHIIPGKSTDFWIDAYNWGECTGGDLYMHFKDVTSVEAGTKLHGGVEYVYTGNPADGGTGDVPKGYREAVSPEPQGAGVWSSEPEKGAEVGGIFIANILIATDDPNLLEEDYASGIADHLGVVVRVPHKGQAGGTILGNPDIGDGSDPTDPSVGDPDGFVDAAEQAAWAVNNTWTIITSLSGKLATIASANDILGTLKTQEKTFIHVDVNLQQIAADLTKYSGTTPFANAIIGDYDQDGDVDASDTMLNWWPTNAVQGDRATWTMLFTLITDDPPAP